MFCLDNALFFNYNTEVRVRRLMGLLSKIKQFNDKASAKLYGEERYKGLQEYQKRKTEESREAYKNLKHEMANAKEEIGKGVASTIQDFKSTRGSGKYLTGHPLISKPRDITVRSNEDGVSLLWTEWTKDKSVLIPWKAIIKITSETKGEITKRASFGKAAAGLFLLGPIGALIGAGMGTTDDNRSMYLTICFTDETGTENDVIIESKRAHKMSTELTAERYKLLTGKQT